MDITDSIRGRVEARNWLARCWRARQRLGMRTDVSVHEFLLQAPMRIAQSFLGLSVTIVPRLPDMAILQGKKPEFEIAGVMDRRRKAIVVVQKYGFYQGRFTLSHEIAHYVLHPEVVLHREVPITASGQKPPLSPEEREANVFGAELLMPARQVQSDFIARYRNAIDGRQCCDAVIYWLHMGGMSINCDDFYALDPQYRAVAVAKARHYLGKPMVSMCEAFRVSATAMAIQLIELGLVK